MNIHFKDLELLKKLNDATIFTSVFGSKLYGYANEKSDIDYLHIYIPSISERNTFYPSHHQLQYKDIENNIDHIYVNIFIFLKNIINGDSTVFFEILNHDNMKNSNLLFLYKMKESFHNYKILRSYLGICNRDLKHIGKQSSDLEKNDKIVHIYRGLEFYKSILNKTFNPTSINKDMILYIKNIDNWKERNDLVLKFKEEIERLRKELTYNHDNKLLKHNFFMDISKQKKLDIELSNFINSDIYKNKSDWYMDLSMYYEANENPEINYE